MDWNKITSNVVTGILGIVLVGGAVLESVQHGTIDPALLVLATAVVSTYFTGTAVRQVNGTKVEALTQSVNALHTRLDDSNIAPAKDGTTT